MRAARPDENPFAAYPGACLLPASQTVAKMMEEIRGERDSALAISPSTQ